MVGSCFDIIYPNPEILVREVISDETVSVVFFERPGPHRVLVESPGMNVQIGVVRFAISKRRVIKPVPDRERGVVRLNRDVLKQGLGLFVERL